MKVVYFGTYSTGEGYPRNRVLVEGLRRAGVLVEEVNEDFWRDAAHKIAGVTGGRRLPGLMLRYAGAWARLAVRYLRCAPHDVVVVGYTGQIDIFLARALAALTGRPVVLDAFLSLFDTLVKDRRLVREGGAFAGLLAFLDRISCRLARLVLLDTKAHARHFSRFTRLPARRFAHLFVGEDDRVFRPAPPRERSPGEPLRVLWFGTWVPLHGVEVVLGAAERLAGSEVHFRLVGRGQQLADYRARAEAIPGLTLAPHWISAGELVEEIAAADVCLGIFGTTAKARRVIPCKVYDALAVGRAVVTADTIGARELLTHREDAWLLPPGDPAALAEALATLAADESLRRRIERGGRELFAARAAPAVLGRRFRDLLLDRLFSGGARCRVRAS